MVSGLAVTPVAVDIARFESPVVAIVSKVPNAALATSMGDNFVIVKLTVV